MGWEKVGTFDLVPDGGEMVVSTHTAEVTFYEVRDRHDIAVWGGEDAGTAIYWLRRKSPAGSRLFVSRWDDDGEAQWLIGSPIDITEVISGALGRDW